MLQTQEHLDKNLDKNLIRHFFKGLLNNLNKAVQKNNGTIHLKTQSCQKDFMSYLFGHKTYRNYLNQTIGTIEIGELSAMFEKVVLKDSAPIQMLKIDCNKAMVNFQKNLNHLPKKKDYLLTENTSYPNICIGVVNNTHLKTPYNIYTPIGQLQILTTNPSHFAILLQEHCNKHNIKYIHLKEGTHSNIDLIEEITQGDLWESVFFQQNDEFSILFTTIIHHFFIANNYKLEIECLEKIISIEGLLSIFLLNNSDSLTKRIIKKYLNKIGIKELNALNGYLHVEQEVLEYHIQNSQKVFEKVKFISYLYKEGFFIRTYQTIIQMIVEQSFVEINFHHITNLLISMILKNYKNTLCDNKILTINETLMNENIFEPAYMCSIGDSPQDNWRDYSHFLLTNIEEITINNDFIATFYNNTQNIIPIFNIKHIKEQRNKSFLWQKIPQQENLYEIQQIEIRG